MSFHTASSGCCRSPLAYRTSNPTLTALEKDYATLFRTEGAGERLMLLATGVGAPGALEWLEAGF